MTDEVKALREALLGVMKTPNHYINRCDCPACQAAYLALGRYPDRQPEAGELNYCSCPDGPEWWNKPNPPRCERCGKLADPEWYPADPPQEPARYVKPAAQVTRNICKGCGKEFGDRIHWVTGEHGEMVECGIIGTVVPAQEKQS